VDESGKRELRRAAAAPDGFLGLQKQDSPASLREGDRGGETIGPRTDDNGVVTARRQEPVAARAAASSSWMVMASSRRVSLKISR
jgi:hypothetical protein